MFDTYAFDRSMFLEINRDGNSGNVATPTVLLARAVTGCRMKAVSMATDEPELVLPLLPGQRHPAATRSALFLLSITAVSSVTRDDLFDMEPRQQVI